MTGLLSKFRKNKETDKAVLVDNKEKTDTTAVLLKPPQEKAKTKTAVGLSVIKHPLVTEKATVLTSRNAYVFAVDPGANKIMIKEAITRQYGVHPVKVRIIRQRGKLVRWGRSSGRRRMIKKAIVTLPPSEKLSVYEGV